MDRVIMCDHRIRWPDTVAVTVCATAAQSFAAWIHPILHHDDDDGANTIHSYDNTPPRMPVYQHIGAVK